MSKIVSVPSTGSVNLIVDQNADFTMVATYNDSSGQPVNLTGYTAAMMVRTGYNEPTAVISLTNTDGITLGGSAGTVTIFVSAARNSTLTGGKTYVYDLLLTKSGSVTRFLQGNYFVDPGVTR